MSVAGRQEPGSPAFAELVARAGHDLRNHLNEVRGFEQLLRHSADLTDLDRRSVDHIRHGGERLATMIETLVTLARLHSGDYVVESLTTDVAALATLARQALPDATVSVSEEAERRSVSLDPAAYQQMLLAESSTGRRNIRLSFSLAADGLLLTLHADDSEHTDPLSLALTDQLSGALGAHPLGSGLQGWAMRLRAGSP